MERPRQGIPLAAVFLLIAVVAIFLALYDSSVRMADMYAAIGLARSPGAVVVLFCVPVGLVAGIGLGLNQPNGLLGALSGAIIGLILGVVSGYLFAQPPHPAVVAGGCGILLAIGGVVRRFSRVTPESD